MTLARQTQAVRVFLVNTNAFNFQIRIPWLERDAEMQIGGQEAPVTRKRSAETDAERLAENVSHVSVGFLLSYRCQSDFRSDIVVRLVRFVTVLSSCCV